NRSNRLFPPDAQERSIATVAEALCKTVMEDANPRLEGRAAAGEELEGSDVVAEIERSITEQSERWKKAGNRGDLPKSYRATIQKKYSSRIEETIARVTEGVGLSEGALKTLAQSVPWYLECSDFLWRNPFNSGIVIAGFG